MLQTSFSKLEKHSPTRLYMIYPMVQSVVLVCVEKVKKMTPQRHCPLSSSSIIHHPKSKIKIILARRLAPTKIEMRHWRSPCVQLCVTYIINFCVTSIIKLNFEFCHTRLHASAWTDYCWRSQQHPSVRTRSLTCKVHYRRTASLSTYTYRGAIFFAPLTTSCAFSARFESKIWILNMMDAPYFGCLSVCLSRRFFVFGWHHCELCWALQNSSRLLCTWKRCGWDSFIMEKGVLLWNKEKGLFLVIFGTAVMILQ
jgi:hypothetical protein